MFLIFWKSEPQRSYKHGSFKKKGVFQCEESGNLTCPRQKMPLLLYIAASLLQNRFESMDVGFYIMVLVGKYVGNF